MSRNESLSGDVELRRVVDTDLPILFQHQLDPEANRIAGLTPRDHETFAAHWTRVRTDPDLLTRAVVVDGELAGHVVSFERNGKREVGYWIGRRFSGRGVATRALSALLSEVYERPIYARVLAGNAGSIRVLEKCGFSQIGEPAEEPGPRDELLYVLDH